MLQSVFDRFFGLKANDTTVSQEVSAGITTFMAMSYLIFVIPGMLSDGGIPREAATSSVILVTVAVTLLMGLWRVTQWALHRVSGLLLSLRTTSVALQGLRGRRA